MSCTRGTLKQIISSYKAHLRSTTASGEYTRIIDPFLYLNIACPPGSYDANVEPAKDDVLFVNADLLLGIVDRWFDSIYGEVQPNPSKPSAKIVSALKPRDIELLLARKEAPVESAPATLSPVVGSSLPAPQLPSKSTTQIQRRRSTLATSAFDSSAAALPYQNHDETSAPISRSSTELPATPSHDSSSPISTAKSGPEPPSDSISAPRKLVWKRSMYAEEEDEEEDLEINLQGQPQSHVDLDLDGDEHLRDINVSNPWAFAKLNAAMRPSGRNKRLVTPGRRNGDVEHSTDPFSDDLPQHAHRSLLEKPLTRFHQGRSSPETAYPTPSPFPFPQKARGKRKADDAPVDALLTPAPSNKERHKRGALDTWVQKSLGGYDELTDSTNTLREDQGLPDLPHPRDFVSARSLPSGGTPLSEIPDASQRPRRKPPPRKQQQGNIDKPFISPVNDPNRVWFDTGENPSQKRPQKPRQNNGQQDTAAAPTLMLRDDDIEDDESVVSASAERSLPLMHPDLAITLDYEARKQKASEAHRKVLREQAAAAKHASRAPADAPDPLHPQHANTSPHKNRQAKAIAALHTPDVPSPATPSSKAPETAGLEASDPRAYLELIHQQRERAPGKPRRQKTAMLPLETMTEEGYTGDLTLMVEDVNEGDVEEDMQESGAWDQYVKSGEVGEAFANVDVEEVKLWEEELRHLLRGASAVQGKEKQEERAEVDVDGDLLEIMQAHAARFI